MQVHQLQPDQRLQAALDLGEPRLKGRTGAGDPEKALRRHLGGQGCQLLHAAAVDVKYAHGHRGFIQKRR